MLVEDTYYSDTPTLDRAALRQEILAYAWKMGLRVHGIERQESGVLPLPKRPSSPSAVAPGIIAAGYQGAGFIRRAVTPSRSPSASLTSSHEVISVVRGSGLNGRGAHTLPNSASARVSIGCCSSCSNPGTAFES